MADAAQGRDEARTRGRDVAELSDLDFAAAVRSGVVVGVPIAFVAVLALLLLVTPFGPGAVFGAIWPALLGGTFLGGIVAIALAEARRTRG